MANRAVAGICKAESVTYVNMIWQWIFGWGPGNFSVALSPTGEAPFTHYGCYAASVLEEEAIVWQQLCDGIIPELTYQNDPVGWGQLQWDEVTTLCTEQEAIDACLDSGLILSNQAGTVGSLEHWNGVLAGLGLQRPYEEV